MKTDFQGCELSGRGKLQFMQYCQDVTRRLDDGW